MKVFIALSLIFAICFSPLFCIAEESDSLFGDFSAMTLDAETATPDFFAEKELTMVNIWTTYCGYCIAEMPDLAELAREYGDKGFQILGIVCDVGSDSDEDDETRILANEIIAETGADAYTHIIPDNVMITAKLYYISSVPTTLFVDQDGRQVGKEYAGSRSKEAWQEIIDELLAIE